MPLPEAVTFSGNVFLPITNVCRNQCKYGADGEVYAFTGIVAGDPNHGGAVNVAGW